MIKSLGKWSACFKLHVVDDIRDKIPPQELYLANDWRQVDWNWELSKDPHMKAYEEQCMRSMFEILKNQCIEIQQGKLRGLAHAKAFIYELNPFEDLPELPR